MSTVSHIPERGIVYNDHSTATTVSKNRDMRVVFDQSIPSVRINWVVLLVTGVQRTTSTPRWSNEYEREPCHGRYSIPAWPVCPHFWGYYNDKLVIVHVQFSTGFSHAYARKIVVEKPTNTMTCTCTVYTVED